MVLGMFGKKPVEAAGSGPAGNETVLLNIEKLALDGGTQSRAGLNDEHVRRLMEAIENGASLPSIRVVYDGTRYFVYDGFHRVEANKRLGRLGIGAEVEQGTQRDAILKSVGANPAHGLPRSKADLRRAVATLLEDGEWAAWSDREIARRTATSHTFVAKVRAELKPTTGNAASETSTRTFVNKHGQQAEMKIGNIGKRTQPEPEADKPTGKVVWGPPTATATVPEPVADANELTGYQFRAGMFYPVLQSKLLIVPHGFVTAALAEASERGALGIQGRNLIDDRQRYLEAGYTLRSTTSVVAAHAEAEPDGERGDEEGDIEIEFGHVVPEEPEQSSDEYEPDLEYLMANLLDWLKENNSAMERGLAEALTWVSEKMYASIAQAWIEAVDDVRRSFEEKEGEE